MKKAKQGPKVEITGIFYRHLELSNELTAEYFENHSLYERAKQRRARLIASIPKEELE